MSDLYKQNKPFPFFGKSKEDDVILLERLCANHAPAPVSSRKRATTSSNSESSLLTSMASRLKLVEQQLAEAQHKINSLTSENSTLKRELSKHNSAFTDVSCQSGSFCHHKIEATKLAKQVAEMEQFFVDYNLRWVGSSAKPPHSDTLDLIELKKAIDLLNEKVSSSMTTNVVGKVGKFVAPTAVQLIIFKDGLTFCGGLLRPFGSPSCDDVLFDLYESFFPSELKETYPNGVLIEFVDRSNLTYSEFLQREPTENRLNGQKGLNFERLLDNLPKSVIKNGKIINIQQDIRSTASRIGLNNNGGSKLPSPSEQINVVKSPIKNDKVYSSLSRTATFQVEIHVKFNITFAPKVSELTDSMLKLICSPEDTMSTVYQMVGDFLQISTNFELFRPIPRQVFNNSEDVLSALNFGRKIVLFCTQSS
ncbi:hypothetical protein RCL1_002929 [Eukaryota sp. TZLM3-RCL]